MFQCVGLIFLKLNKGKTMDDRTEEVIKCAIEHFTSEQHEMTNRICEAIKQITAVLDSICLDIEEIKRNYIPE
jgi:hypothetical protein